MRQVLSPLLILPLVVWGIGLACTRSSSKPSALLQQSAYTMTPITAGNSALYLPPTRPPGAPLYTPTPDQPHLIPTLRPGPEQYTVQSGDTLRKIADRYGVSIEDVAKASGLADPDWLEIGQVLTIPRPTPLGRAPDFKIIPDSELVYSPYTSSFDVEVFVNEQGGYLAKYHEEVEKGDEPLSGAEIVARIAREYSVNPRLLLAVLEYRSGWVTKTNIDEKQRDYPMGFHDKDWEGLYKQLSYAANELNRGYYLWRVNGLSSYVLADGTVVIPSATINAGTAGVQHFFARLEGLEDWLTTTSDNGLAAVYRQFFGYPFDYAWEPPIPPGLVQPPLQLPFEAGKPWYLTSGPHGGWGSGSAWAALDFAPYAEKEGCLKSDDWVTAIADGLIVRVENGAVVQDLDGDGLEQTGWTILYMHIESRDRIQSSVFLRAGDRIGHPSCEGGFSTGTHVHLARRYNGEWIPADGPLPFILDGWVSGGNGVEYDGFLRRGDQVIEAYDGRSPENEITR